MKHLAFAAASMTLAVCCLPAEAEARPVSYEGGTTLITEHDRDMSAIWAHYTPHHRYSIGYRGEWHREDDHVFHGAQATGSPIAGSARTTVPISTSLALQGLPMAWTVTRRVRALPVLWALWRTGRHAAGSSPTWPEALPARPPERRPCRPHGWALPLTWPITVHSTPLMVQVEHSPEAENPVGVTPLVRFFQGPLLAEFGWSVTDDKPFIQLQYRF